MLKIGDKVKVIELDMADTEDTNLELGSVGVITDMDYEEDYDEYDVCYVDFGTGFTRTGSANSGPNGTYGMYMNQLEAADEEEEE